MADMPTLKVETEPRQLQLELLGRAATNLETVAQESYDRYCLLGSTRKEQVMAHWHWARYSRLKRLAAGIWELIREEN